MTSQTLNTLYWQEQEQRADALRSILERTFVAAQARGRVQLIQDSENETQLWAYQSKDHTLVYAPETDVFWVASQDAQWRVNWQGQEPLSDLNSEITSEQFADFQPLKEWLDGQGIPQEVSLFHACEQAVQQQNQLEQASQVQQEAANSKVEAISAVAERLFEYYASQGEAAYKLASDSTEHIYKFVMDDRVYLVSRDEAAGTYNVGREGSPMNLRNQEGITDNDVQIWSIIGDWLTEREQLISQAQQPASWTDTYWSQQETRANQILPVAERIFAYQEARGVVSFNPERQSHVARGKAGEYEIGYIPTSDTFWVQRGEEFIAAATDHLHNYDRRCDRWQESGLEHIEQITEQDVQRFIELDAWLDVKDRYAGRKPGEQLLGSQIYLNRSSIAASTQTQERDWVQRWQELSTASQNPAFPLQEQPTQSPVESALEAAYDFEP